MNRVVRFPNQSLSRIGRLCALTFIFLFFRLHARAQNGVVGGHVTDSKGSSIVKATVDIRNDATGVVSTALTNNDGYYFLPPVAPGSYVLHV